jgi:preprotein translocase SecE subunit
MSVAETPKTERMPRSPQQQFAIGSAIGGALLLAGVWFVFAGLPMAWSLAWEAFWTGSLGLKASPFLSEALLLMMELVVIGGLVFFAYGALQKWTQPGLRAGIVFAALYYFFTLWIVVLLGGLLDDKFEDNPLLGGIILAGIAGAMLAGAGYVYLMIPGWFGFLETVEYQGWFHATMYKGNQGVRVRRGTIMGILAVGACGIYTMVKHKVFGEERADGNDWFWTVPYSHQEMYIPLMFTFHLVMPAVVGVVLLWLAWRIVSIPAFADFLVATEAEMNKVSWTGRRRLVTDTIVVLTTVFLFTTFLFVVDVLWIKILSAPGIQVLMIDTKAEAAKQQEKAQW